jgi:hypothetical protein
VRSLLGKASVRRGRPPGSTNKGSTNKGSTNKGSTNAGSTDGGSRAKRPGRLSAAARKRIAAAQKRRWAEYRKSAGAKSE